MKTFITVLKNNYLRTVPRLVVTVVMSIIMILTILLAVYVTGIQQIRGHIAFITDKSSTEIQEHLPYLEIVNVTKEPPRSTLYKQQYDAFVSRNADGTFSIETLRNDRFRKMIEMLFEHPDLSGKERLPTPKRGVGENIIGFLMMFLLLQASMNLFAFANDKEQGQLTRIAVSPASFGWYLAAHCVYSLSILLPSWLTLVVLKLAGISIGFSLGEYAVLIAITGFIGIAIALLLNTYIKKPDNANMLGNSILMLTTVLAGSFYAAPPEHSVFNYVIRILPQKAIMKFAETLENGTASQHIGLILYVVGFSLVLIGWACIVLKRKYTAYTAIA